MIESGAFFQRDVGLPVGLRVPSCDPLPMTLLDVRLYAPAGGPLKGVIRVEMELSAFQRLEDEQLAGFLPGSVDPGVQGYELTSAAPIELQLRFEPGFHGHPSDALIDAYVADITSDSDTPANEAESYRWLAVLQEQTARPGVVMKRGFRSVYS